MAKDYSKTAAEILKQLGGAENVTSVTHCMTRLRFILKDETGIDDEKVEAIKGVMGIMKKGGQYQVIIGNDVSVCYNEVLKLGRFSEDADDGNSRREKLTVGGVVNSVLDAITGSLSPIIPAILGCGMIKLLNIILNMAGVPDTDSTYQLLVILGDAAFYFLPILVAASAAKRFRCNTALAMTIVAVLIHPSLITMLAGEQAVTFLHLPVTEASYASSVIPALLITWVMSYVEKLVDKITPSWTKTIFKPTLIMLIMLPLSLVLLAPLGNLVGVGLQTALTWLQQKASWLTMMLLGAFMPFIVMTGMHQVFTPTILGNLAGIGYETMILPGMLASNLAQGAACLAVSLRSKNSEMKSVAGASAVSALIAGITEPGMYGVTLRLKRPMIAACIGGGASGLFIGIVNLKSYALAAPGFISMIQFISPDGGRNLIYALIAAAVSVVVTFIATLILGWEDPEEKPEETQPSAPEIAEYQDRQPKNGEKTVVEAPVKGEVIPLERVNDETFSSGMMGHGLAVEPSEGKVYAPFDGTCETIMDSLHALGLVSDNGVSLLIHVGLETVGLNGRPFTAHVKSGDRIRKGQLLLEFDMEQIRLGGCETVTIVLVTNEDEVGEAAIENNRIVIGG